MIKSYTKVLGKSTDLGGQKWSKNGIQYFFTFNVKKYLLNRHRNHLGQKWARLGPRNFASWRVLAPSWTDFNFFLALLGRLLGPSGRRQGPPGGLPGAFWRLFFSIFCNDDNLHHKKRIFKK